MQLESSHAGGINVTQGREVKDNILDLKFLITIKALNKIG